LLGGNFYQSKPEVGIYDAGYGLLLKGDGKGNFVSIHGSQSGFFLKGAVRDIITIKNKNKNLVIAARNNDQPKIFE
jgi:enediyne biosynthesis protein E4